jgi:hypothetical protein
MKSRFYRTAALVVTKIQKLFSEDLAKENDFFRVNLVKYGRISRDGSRNNADSLGLPNALRAFVARTAPPSHVLLFRKELFNQLPRRFITALERLIHPNV